MRLEASPRQDDAEDVGRDVAQDGVELNCWLAFVRYDYTVGVTSTKARSPLETTLPNGAAMIYTISSGF